jgi:mRNA-degrading endonuclease RelE of RelBE toxin-antitoxin system
MSGCYKIKLLQHGVRLIFAAKGAQPIVLVLAKAKREDGVVCGAATARLSQSVG